jgi:hypothetical protein
MANGNGGSKLTPLWLVAGGLVLVLAGMTTLVAIHPLDFSAPKAVMCEGESCAGHDSAPGERPETSHAAPAGEHEAAPPAEHHE